MKLENAASMCMYNYELYTEYTLFNKVAQLIRLVLLKQDCSMA